MSNPLPFAKHLANLESAKPPIEDAVKAIVERAKTLADKEGKRKAPQEAIAAFAHIRDLMKALEKAEEAVKKALTAHIEAGGPVEAGEYALSVVEQERTTVKWEEVATAAAQKIATLEGRPFNAANYVSTIKDGTEPTIVKMLKVVKVSGA